MKCPICKKENSKKIAFCAFCRYPVNIKRISELSKKDLAVYLESFLEVISKKRKPLFENKELEQIYQELLSINWLRPESALFRFMEAKILLGFKNKYLKYPVLDLGCGDGLFTAILFGAKINKNYDAYSAVDFSQKDIFNSYIKLPTDFFEKKPSAIGFGLDIKENAVLMASQLKVYDKVKKGDVRKIPFRDESVNSIFSNMIDDVKTEDLSAVFKEANRVLKKNGYFIFTTPTKRFKEFLFYQNKAQQFKKQGKTKECSYFLKLDRGRSAWEARPLSFWKKIFQKTPFEIVEYIEYGNADLIKFWDTGFRPFFSYLMAFRNILVKNNLCLIVKSIFLEVLGEYLSKYIKGQNFRKGAFAIIVAKKNYEKRK